IDDFTFLGAAAFSGAVGEIRTDIVGTDVTLEFDFDGDQTSDASILLLNFTGTIDTNDFNF
ncbi:MAG: hypothetical protein NXH84_15845, partial [Rhodobacteraceae bacterium]|nr:hypothetical protein [Paracoccaceae bacterium]